MTLSIILLGCSSSSNSVGFALPEELGFECKPSRDSDVCKSPAFPGGYLQVSSSTWDFPGIPLDVGNQFSFSECSHPAARCARDRGTMGVNIRYQAEGDRYFGAAWLMDDFIDQELKAWPTGDKLLPLVHFDELDAECRAKTGEDCPLTLGPWQEYDAAKGHSRILKP